jgi:uncharacterized protein YkwD
VHTSSRLINLEHAQDSVKNHHLLNHNFLKGLSLFLVLTFFVLVGSARASESTPQPNDSSTQRPFTGEGPTLLYSGCGGIEAPEVNSEYEQRVIELVNIERAKLDIPPLKRTQGLDAAARYHATDLGQDNYFNHDSYDRKSGKLTYVCSTWQRIATYFSGAGGENAAAGYPSPEAVMKGWMNSAGHRSNILSLNYWQIGVGYFSGSGDYITYWIQDFGKEEGVFPLVISGEAYATDVRLVPLYIYGSWDEMRLRNESGNWTEWQPFRNKLEWTLDHGIGLHTVIAEFRNGNQTETASDTIYLSKDDDSPRLGDLPSKVSFIYSIADQELMPEHVEMTPRNIGNDLPLTWEITTKGSFFDVDPLKGTSPESLIVTAKAFDKFSPGDYSGKLIVAVSDPAAVAGSPAEIAIELHVIETSLHTFFLPGVFRR